MKIKFKYGNIKVKIEDKGELLSLYNKSGSPIDMFSKSNIESLNKLYENIPQSLVNYYKDVNKAFEKYMKIKKTEDNIDIDYLNILPASGHDIYNYVARYGLANYQIQTIMKLDGHLDFQKLSQAVRLSIEDQPVFGCHFIENEPPYWEKLKNIDDGLFCSIEETENIDQSVQLFLESPLDMDNDPMVKVKLIRSQDFDTICLKINHSCCDGTGTKEYLQLLSEIYTSIDQNNGSFIPNPRKRNRDDQDLLFRNLGITDPETEWIPGSEITRATWPFPWIEVKQDKSGVVISRLTQQQYHDIYQYSKNNGATINDIILTAYYRAMSVFGEPNYLETMEIPVTIDLRRFLKDNKTEGIKNFSGSEISCLTLIPDESFSDTLSRVITMMNKIKDERPGLQSAIGLERVEKLTFSEALDYYKMVAEWPNSCSDKCAPVLSNLGIIADSLLTFGKIVATDAYIIPPVVQIPGFLLMVNTYNNIISLSVGFYEGTILREDVEKLLNKIRDEIIEGCI